MTGRGGFLPGSSEPECGTWEAKHQGTAPCPTLCISEGASVCSAQPYDLVFWFLHPFPRLRTTSLQCTRCRNTPAPAGAVPVPQYPTCDSGRYRAGRGAGKRGGCERAPSCSWCVRLTQSISGRSFPHLVHFWLPQQPVAEGFAAEQCLVKARASSSVDLFSP